MHGPLSEIGLADVLQLLERGGRSGVLRVVGPDPTMPRTVLLHEGRIGALEPDAGDEAVASTLVARSLAPPGDGAHTAVAAIREATRRQLATRALAAMLHWTRGRFDFEEHPVPQGPLQLSPDAVMFALVDAESRREALADRLDGFHAVPALAPAAAIEGGEPVALGVREWRVLDAVDGLRDVEAIAALLDEAVEDVAASVDHLVAATILELRRPLVETARRAMDDARYDEATRLLRARLVSVPTDADAWRALGLAEVGAGRFDRAVEAWTAWQGVDPDNLAEASALIHAARTMIDALRER